MGANMTSVLDDVDLHTKIAGNNRLEMLLFYLGNDKQYYGINVFKVQEVIHCPSVTKIPDAHPTVKGIVDIRGKTMPVIDLSLAIGKTNSLMQEDGFLIVSEYNQTVQGFLVKAVDRIINLKWVDIKPPPHGLGHNCHLTSVATVDDKFIEILDVEEVLSNINMKPMDVSDTFKDKNKSISVEGRFVLIADDSSVARNQIKKPLENMGITCYTVNDGKVAFDLLNFWKNEEPEKLDKLGVIISDIEMPNMDGYTLVKSIRDDENLKNLSVILHSSLSGIFNSSMVELVGADKFVAKYDPDILCEEVINRIGRH